ncbi:Rap1 GTPase-GDP dissociation stimulator 1 [Coniosporium apollinis]|uniref:Rap1 GTPase-GDP dissociation stimulator 1 n=1 Tax=Coniosporium apollinis TaxID=61459 RepID=A0ABQ9P3N9_9PEZI|nr:Rap1 GTPase-GDP dissociation stimulator 1 [Coniosporium apollinis]
MAWLDSSRPDALVARLETLPDDPPDGLERLPDDLSRLEEINPTLHLQAIKALADASRQCRNRAMTVKFLGHIISFLDVKALIGITVGVLFNLCNDSEDSQMEAARLKLACILATLIATQSIAAGSAAASQAIQLLYWTVQRMSQTSTLQSLDSPELLTQILSFLECSECCEDPENFVMLGDTALLFYDFLESYIAYSLLDRCLGVYRSAVKFVCRLKDEERLEEADSIASLSTRLLHGLSGVSTAAHFTATNDFSGPVIRRLLDWLDRDERPLQTCACIMLGNYAVDTRRCEEMVQAGVDAKVVRIMREARFVIASDPLEDSDETLHAAAGLVGHLAIPAKNKERLGHGGVIEEACFLLSSSVPQLQRDGAYLLRLLLNRCLPNVHHVVDKRPAGSLGPTSEAAPLLDDLLLASSTVGPASIDASRAIFHILRGLHLLGADHERLATLYRSQIITSPFLNLLRQKEDPAVRSEGLLGLALMAQTQPGALCVLEALKDDANFELITLREDNPHYHGGDKANTLCMIHGLLQNGGETDSDTRGKLTDMFHDLSRERKDIVVTT